LSTSAYINLIETAVPDHAMHQECTSFIKENLVKDKDLKKYNSIVENLGINQRYSVLTDLFDDNGLYKDLTQQPTTELRMQLYQNEALKLASKALDKLILQVDLQEVTHIIISSCTGFYAPGLDLEIIKKYQLKHNIERTFIGFMGCHAALNTLKSARHIVLANPKAKVLIVNLELSSLHFQASPDLNQLISNLIFADGCAASVVSSQAYGLKIQDFKSTMIPESKEDMTWLIKDYGFEIYLDKNIIGHILKQLKSFVLEAYQGATFENFIVHPGGKGILDAVEKSLKLASDSLKLSRDVLFDCGNMSSATIMFILARAISDDKFSHPENLNLTLAFGPGMVIESMSFFKINSSLDFERKRAELVTSSI
jgi:predicted naringenin-chalcone synthase